jgi:hypothetical protein
VLEQAAEGGAGRSGPLGELERRETLFDRAQRPARVDGQALDGLAGFVQRTDVAKLHGLPVPLVDPPQRKALGPADVGALRVDSAGPLVVEEGACSLGVRRARSEQLGVVTTDGLDLHVEDRQAVHAAPAAPAPAMEPLCVQKDETARLAIDPCAQNDERVQSSLYLACEGPGGRPRYAAQMAFIPSGAEWYVAEIVERIRVQGDRRSLVHVNTCLIRAKTPDEAYDKALRLGERRQTVYVNSHGKEVRIAFLGLQDLNVVHDALEDGAERVHRAHLGMTDAAARTFVVARRSLSIFRRTRRPPGPDCASASVLREATRRTTRTK